MTDVLVAGAGVGGLTAALSLHAAGIGVRVVDAADQLR
ncbi:FAD-binding protein, partial [Streptomyces sp. SID10115]